MFLLVSEHLGAIRIKSAPKSEAPVVVSRKWVGVEIPCLYYDPFCLDRGGVIFGEPDKPDACYAVLQVHALDALSCLSPDAVKWWNSIGFPQEKDAVFFFQADCVEVLKPPLSLQKILCKLN